VALKQAQDLGFAETDPKLDIEAFDPKFKLCIILLHAFGLFIKPEDVYNFGIHRLNDFDINYANEKNFKIKLVARCKKVNNKIVAYVLPQFVDSKNKLRDVNKEYNGIVLESVFSESQFFVGKGAGSNPTGSAVLSDISALTYNYKYEYKKLNQRVKYSYHSDEELRIYLRYKNIEEVDFDDFNRIEQRFESDNENYIIGTINLQKIIAADWLKWNDVNIISLN
jgi:homoserine dehydrogenase